MFADQALCRLEVEVVVARPESVQAKQRGDTPCHSLDFIEVGSRHVD